MGFVALTSQPRGVQMYAPTGVYARRPAIPPTRRTTGSKPERQREAGGAAPPQSQSQLSKIWSQVVSDPGVQESQGKRTKEIQEAGAWDNAGWLGKLGIVAGKALQPFDYLNYPRRAVQVGMLELMEASQGADWKKGIFTDLFGEDTDKIRGERSNWDLISGKPSADGAGGLGFGDMVRDDLRSKGPSIPLPFGRNLNTGDVADNMVGLAGDIATDPLTYVGVGAAKAANPLMRATQEAAFAETAMRNSVDDLATMLAKGGHTDEVLNQTIDRTVQQLDAWERARLIAQETPAGQRLVELPRNRLGRAQLVADVRRYQPEVYEQFKDELVRGATRGFANVSPELKQALGITDSGITFGGMRIPGTRMAADATNAAFGAAKQGIGRHIPGVSRWRDPEGLGTALDTLTRGRGGNVDSAVDRIMLESGSRVASGAVRREGGAQVRQFNRDVLRPLRRQGREAVEEALHEAETVGGTAFNRVFSNVLDTYARVTGRSIDPMFLRDRDTYIPHKLTGPFKRYLRSRSHDPAVHAFQKETDFMTVDLLDQANGLSHARSFVPNPDGSPATYKLGDTEFTISDGSIRDLNQALKKAFPDFKGKFYEDDPAILLESYVTSRARDAGIAASLNRMASNPNIDEVARVSGEPFRELVARDEALRNDPAMQLIEDGYTREQAAEFGYTQLGVPRGPGAPAPVGPVAPQTPTRTKAQIKRGEFDPNPWTDDPNGLFKSEPDLRGTAAREKLLRDQRDDPRQGGAGIPDLAPDWRRASRQGKREAKKEVVKEIRDLRANVMHGMRNQPRVDSSQIKQVTQQIANMRRQVKSWSLKAEQSTETLEQVIREARIFIEDLRAESERIIDDAGRVIGEKTIPEVEKKMQQTLNSLKALVRDSEEALATAPSRMRAEAAERLATLLDPTMNAMKRLREVEQRALTAGPSRVRIRNAQKVLSDKAGSTFDQDTLRLAELEARKEALDAAERAERRALKSKFTQRGEHGAETKARKVLAEAQKAQDDIARDRAIAQRAVDDARFEASIKHEATVYGANTPKMRAEDPTMRVTDPVTGEPMMDLGPVISGPETATRTSPLMTGTESFGVDRQRNVGGDTTGLNPKDVEGIKARETFGQRAERARRQREIDPSIPKPAGETEEEAIERLEQMARIVESGEENDLTDALADAKQRLDEVQQSYRPGAVADAPEVRQAFDDLQAKINAHESAIAEQQALKDAAIEAANRVRDAATIGMDERIVDLQDLTARREELRSLRDYHKAERQQLINELKAIGQTTRVNQKKTIEELVAVYDDLEMIAWANPQLDDDALNQAEVMLNSTLTKLRELQAIETTDAHVRKLIQAAFDDKLGPVMRSTAASGWTMLRRDARMSAGELVVKDELWRQMQNLYELVDEPKWLGRALSQMTNLFKTYATLSLGFHVRNSLSAIFMNTSDGVPLKLQAQGAFQWAKLLKGGREWYDAQPATVRQAIDATIASGAGGRFGEAGFADAGTATRRFWQALNYNKATRWSQEAGQYVEGGVRLGMALDSIKRGDSLEMAVERISRIHFDYTQISSFDRKARQFIPFWTFYSRNLPLQIQQMWTKPKAYSWFASVMDAAPPDAEYTPEYWMQPGNANLDTKVSGGMLYANFDMPFSRSAEQIEDLAGIPQGDWRAILSQANPWLAAPAEWLTGKDFFTGQSFDRDNPDDYTKVSGPLGVPINVLAKLTNQQDAAGRTYEPFTNMIRSVLPMVDRSARLAPAVLDTGAQSKEPQWASWARFGGAPIRVLTEEQQRSERARRNYALKEQAQMRQAIAAYLAQQQAN